VADGLLGDGGLEAPLQLLLEPNDLPAVHGDTLLGLPVGQLDDVDGLEIRQHLIHLLLAVAGGLAHHQIGEVEEGTLVRLGEAVAGLDEGTQVPGQILLGVGDGLIRHGTQAHHRSAHGTGQLLGEVGAEGTHHRYALLLQLLDGQKGVSPLIGKLFKNFRQILFQFNHMLDPFFSHIS
jgi:hypothetical protein